jgi:hypothetical protein
MLAGVYQTFSFFCVSFKTTSRNICGTVWNGDHSRVLRRDKAAFDIWTDRQTSSRLHGSARAPARATPWKKRTDRMKARRPFTVETRSGQRSSDGSRRGRDPFAPSHLISDDLPERDVNADPAESESQRAPRSAAWKRADSFFTTPEADQPEEPTREEPQQPGPITDQEWDAAAPTLNAPETAAIPLPVEQPAPPPPPAPAPEAPAPVEAPTQPRVLQSLVQTPTELDERQAAAPRRGRPRRSPEEKQREAAQSKIKRKSSEVSPANARRTNQNESSELPFMPEAANDAVSVVTVLPTGTNERKNSSTPSSTPALVRKRTPRRWIAGSPAAAKLDRPGERWKRRLRIPQR